MIPDGHDWLDVAGVIAGLFVALGGISGLVAVVLAVMKLRPETTHLNAETEQTKADTLGRYQDMTDKAIDRAFSFNDRMLKLENENSRLLDELNKIKVDKDATCAENKQLTERVNVLEAEVLELRAIMEQMGVTPPPRKQRIENK